MNTITVDEVRDLIEKKEDFILLNVLDKKGFDKGFIPSSINVPIDDVFEGEVKNKIIDKNKRVVVYCSGSDSEISKIAAQKLENMGFKNVFLFEGGIKTWKSAGLSLEKSA